MRSYHRNRKGSKKGGRRARGQEGIPAAPTPEPLSDTDSRVVEGDVSQLTGRPRGKREREALRDGTPRGQRK